MITYYFNLFLGLLAFAVFAMIDYAYNEYTLRVSTDDTVRPLTGFEIDYYSDSARKDGPKCGAIHYAGKDKNNIRDIVPGSGMYRHWRMQT